MLELDPRTISENYFERSLSTGNCLSLRDQTVVALVNNGIRILWGGFNTHFSTVGSPSLTG